MTLETERRKENRKRPPSLVYVELASANGGMMRDICEEGFAVRAMMPLHIGDSTPFAFSVDASTRFEGHGQVLWVEEEGKVAGLKFTDVSPQLLEQVRGWLAEEGQPPSNVPAVSIAPKREVNTLDELRRELRGVGPRVEAQPVEMPRAETPRVEASHTEIRRMEIPRAQKPEIQVREEGFSPTEGDLVPPAAMEPEQIVSPAQEKIVDEAQREDFSLAEPDSSHWAGITSQPRTLEPLPGLHAATREPPRLIPLPELHASRTHGDASGVAERLDSTTVLLAVRILIFLVLVAGAVVYHRELGSGLIWLGAKLSGTQASSSPPVAGNSAPMQMAPTSTVPDTSPAGDATQNSARNTVQKEASPPLAAPETKKPIGAPLAGAENPEPTTSKPGTQTTANPGAATSPSSASRPLGMRPLVESNSEAGQQEYTQAQDILKGKSREGGLSEAVRLLWIAVEKGNSAAEVSLAELYRVGEGVSKNCDQTKILLTAAARKGNAEAQKRLEQFLKEGCE
jgi:PilZ domain